MKHVVSVAADVGDDGPPEGEDEDEGGMSSRNDFGKSLWAGHKRPDALLPRLTVVLAP